MSCRIELAQRRDFKEFFDILEHIIQKNFSTSLCLSRDEYAWCAAQVSLKV